MNTEITNKEQALDYIQEIANSEQQAYNLWKTRTREIDKLVNKYKLAPEEVSSFYRRGRKNYKPLSE